MSRIVVIVEITRYGLDWCKVRNFGGMKFSEFEGVYGYPPHNILSQPRFMTVHDEFWRRVEHFLNLPTSLKSSHDTD